MIEPVPTTDLQCYRGETPSWDFPIIRDEGAVDLTSAVLDFYASPQASTTVSDALMHKTITDGITVDTPASGIVTVALTADDTAIARGLLFQLWLTEGAAPNTRDTMVAHGRLVILEG